MLTIFQIADRYMERVFINKKEYQYITHYKNDNYLREIFYSFTQKVWKFDFRKWYNSGYWEDSCLLYSLLDKDKMVSHITVSIIDFIVLGQKKRFIQLGTVSTDPEYRKLGLNRFLLEKVLQEWNNKCDLIYLFANDSVLEYYPLFGFTSVNEYQAIKMIAPHKNSYTVRKINIDNADDHNLLYNKAKNSLVQFKVSMIDNVGQIMFYCNYFDKFSFKENIYYIEPLDTVVIAEYKALELTLYDIYSTRTIEIEEVIHAMATSQTEKVIMHFMPITSEIYEIELSQEEDTTLFVFGDSKELFEKHKLIFPILSHT